MTNEKPIEPKDECCAPVTLTLDEAIQHAEECINDTPCGQMHKQLADWLKELKDFRGGDFGKCKPLRDVLLEIHDELENYVSHKTVVESMCLRIKNIINDALKPNIWGNKKIDNSLLPDEYVSTMPALAKAASVFPYGGVTGRPRKLKGYLKLPDGREFWLGEIGVKFDGWGDGLITDVNLDVLAERFERTETEEEDVTDKTTANDIDDAMHRIGYISGRLNVHYGKVESLVELCKQCSKTLSEIAKEYWKSREEDKP